NPFVKIDGLIRYDENIPLDTNYMLMGKDARYSATIADYISVKYGSLEGIRAFLESCLEIVEKEDIGVSYQKAGVPIQITGTESYKRIALFGMLSDSNGYVIMTKSQL